jgi:hypothetical protein
MDWLKRSAVTVAGVCLLLGGIVLMPLPGPGILVVDDVRWPLWDSLMDSVWGPSTGGVVAVTSRIPLVTTAVSLRGSHEDERETEVASVSS